MSEKGPNLTPDARTDKTQIVKEVLGESVPVVSELKNVYAADHSVAQIKKDLDGIYSTPNIQHLDTVDTKDIRLKKNESNHMGSKLRNVTTAILSVLSIIPAHAKAGGETKKEDTKKKHTIENMQKVLANPENQGFTQVDIENINGKIVKIYKKESQENLPIANVEKNAKNDPKYEKWLEEKLGNGISPEELAAKKYISESEIPKYAKYYKPSNVYVYTEEQPKDTVIPVSSHMDIKPTGKINVEMKVPPRTKIFNIDGYKKVVILFDNSPSMKDSRKILAADLKSTMSNVPIDISGFTENINTTFSASTSAEAATIIRSIRLIENNNDDEFREFAVTSALEKIKLLENTPDPKLMVVCTDEELQGVTGSDLYELQEQAIEKNVTVEFSILVPEYDRGLKKEVMHKYSIPLSVIIAQYGVVFNARIKNDIKHFDDMIAINERQIRETKAEIGNTDAKTARQLQKKIPELEEEIRQYKVSRENCQSIRIDNFSEFATPLSSSEVSEDRREQLE